MHNIYNIYVYNVHKMALLLVICSHLLTQAIYFLVGLCLQGAYLEEIYGFLIFSCIKLHTH